MQQDDGVKKSKPLLLRRIISVVKVVLVPDTAGYFFWACLFYLATGILHSQTLPRLTVAFCHVRPNGTDCTEDCPDMLLLCPASECFGSAMNLTWTQEANTAKKSYNQAFLGASLNKACLDMMKFATSPVDAIHLIHTRNSDANLAVNEDCKILSCRVLANALYLMPDLENGGNNCTNTYNTKSAAIADSCPCSGLLGTITSTVQAEIDSVCGERLLNDGCGKYGTTPSFCNSTGTRRLDLLAAPKTEGPPCKTPSWQEEMTEVSFWDSLSSAPSRQLQVNNDAPAWTVGEWSTCTCFEQCMPGLQTRIVQCGGAVCRGNQPESTKECVCSHCGACSAETVLFVSMIVNFSQAAVAFILGLALAYFGSLTEENLIKIGILKKLAGFFCKNLPTLENLADLASLGLFSWIMIITYIPAIFELKWMEDCFHNELLRVSAFIPLVLWLCRLMLGRCAKRYTRVPPQLYTPVRRLPMGLRQLNTFMRCLGPV